MAASMSSGSNATPRHPLVGVDLDDIEDLDVERLGMLVRVREVAHD